jgi:hypothetical protein
LKIGEAFKTGLNIFIGAASHPMVFIEMIKNGLTYAFLQGLNALAAGFKSVRLYFQDGMLETVQGLGYIIEATFIKAFAVPIAYFQAGIDDVLFKLPKAFGGSGEKEDAQREAAQHLGTAQAHAQAAAESRVAGNKEEGAHFNDLAKKEYAAYFDALKRAQGQTVEERAQRYMSGKGPQADFGGKMLTADEGYNQGIVLFKEGLGKAKQAIKASPIEDIFNAGEAKAKMQIGANYLANQGQQKANTVLDLDQQRARRSFRQNASIFGRPKALEMAGYLPEQGKPLSYAAQVQYYNSNGRAAYQKLMQNGGIPLPQAVTAQAVAQTVIPDIYAGALSKPDYGLGAGGDQAYNHIRRGDAARQKAFEAAEKNKKEDKLGKPGVLDVIAERLQ